MNEPFGRQLPRLLTPPPGPRSLALAARLRRVESRNITHIAADWPVFWEEASGANVRDADGNVYVDLTAGFGVATAGHAAPAVSAAIAEQAARLPHGLGDVHPSRVKVELLERLASLMPPGLEVTALGTTGADAVEIALKTALLATGRSGLIAFGNGYHGLTLGTLSVTDRRASSGPFADRLGPVAARARFPDGAAGDDSSASLAEVRRLFDAGSAASRAVGAVIVEPIQGRGGIVVPPADFLPALRALCDELGILLIVDEIYTGLGRTGRWLACEHWGVVPDIVTIGKALGGSLPISAAIGSARVMEAWPASTGEAIHTSTFLGNPTACAAALAQLGRIEDDELMPRAEALGARIESRVQQWVGSVAVVVRGRGIGLMRGVELRRPADESAGRDALVKRLLRRGILVLTEGPRGDVLAITPPLVITEAQLEHALDAIEEELAG
ncbi:MAG TPA: aspartate aminotransferase family protein [Longimicrobiales bacterium]|nr:aspartate aminotransferase family protein [Longimicrobiales bacterium]